MKITAEQLIELFPNKKDEVQRLLREAGEASKAADKLNDQACDLEEFAGALEGCACIHHGVPLKIGHWGRIAHALIWGGRSAEVYRNNNRTYGLKLEGGSSSYPGHFAGSNWKLKREAVEAGKNWVVHHITPPINGRPVKS